MWLIFTLIHLLFKLASYYHTVIFSFVLTNAALVDVNFMRYWVNVMSSVVGNVKFCGFQPNIVIMGYTKETSLHCRMSV